MMGKAMISLDAPIVKGTSGILVMKEKESSRAAVQNCIRCGKCVTVCPMGLSPFLLALFGESERYDALERGVTGELLNELYLEIQN